MNKLILTLSRINWKSWEKKHRLFFSLLIILFPSLIIKNIAYSKTNLKQDAIFMSNNTILKGKILTTQFHIITPQSEIILDKNSISRIRIFNDSYELCLITTWDRKNIRGILKENKITFVGSSFVGSSFITRTINIIDTNNKKQNENFLSDIPKSLIRTIRFAKSTPKTSKHKNNYPSTSEICSSDMAEVRGEFCIDKYKFPNIKGKYPLVNISWYEAKAKCENVGKRLCTQQEWRLACMGIGNLGENFNKHYYPYNKSKCITPLIHYQDPILNVNGASADCKNWVGVHDQIIGVSEWLYDGIDEDGKSYKFIASPIEYHFDEISDTCEKIKISPPDSKFDTYGFRCCK